MPGKVGQKKQILYDTSIIIGYLRGNKACKSKVENVRKGKTIGFVSVVTVFELYVGALLAPETSEALRDVRELFKLVSATIGIE
ncbi:MAG: hypothetical protein ONB05_08710 [candidate division KSB1 bacterium]|nr:hypothetical protein [candidate division KSB1 bacterium]